MSVAVRISNEKLYGPTPAEPEYTTRRLTSEIGKLIL